MDKTFSINHYNLRTYDNIRKIEIGQGDDYTTGCSLDYPFFINYYKVIPTDLSKQFYCKSKSTWKHNNVFHY